MVSNVPQDIPLRKLHFSQACQYLKTDPSASFLPSVLRTGLPELNTGGMSFKIRRPARLSLSGNFMDFRRVAAPYIEMLPLVRSRAHSGADRPDLLLHYFVVSDHLLH